MSKNDSSLQKHELFVDGEWRPARTGKRLPVDDPATGQTIAEVADASAEDARDAVAAAHRAWPAWRAKTATERSDLLWRLWQAIDEHKDELARLMTAEQGKPLRESRAEIEYGNGFIRWFAEEARRAYGELIPPPDGDRRVLAIRQSVGVAAAITPWNFPNAMITRKIAPALAAGCPVVVKPAAQTPLSALALAELARRAGFPAGVFNVVVSSDAAAIGEVFTGDERVRKLSFTGSTAVGRKLMAACAEQIKKLSLELGGNAPLIVFDDADLDTAVDGLMIAKFRNTGQSCIAANRVLVQSGIYERFLARIGERIAGLKVGPGTGDEVDIGPLIDDEAVEKIRGLLDDARANGAEIRMGGDVLADLGPRFFAPTVLERVTPKMRLSCEEIFGPVVALMRFDDEAEAIRIANDTPYGLASYCFTQDLARAWRVAEALETGLVGVNEGAISNPAAPFGGIKQSGLGREGSRHGLDEYLEIKYVCMGGLG